MLPDVRLVPVTQQIRDRVLALAPKPGQEEWSGVPVDTLPAAELDPSREPYAIVMQAGMGSPPERSTLPSPPLPLPAVVYREVFVASVSRTRFEALRLEQTTA